MIDGHNSLTQLPQGWVWTILGEISSLGAGNPAPQGEEYFDNGTYPFVRVQDMGSLGNVVYIYDTRDHLNNKAVEKLRLFPKGSVLFTKSGMSILLNQRAILGRDMYVVSHVGIAIPLGGIPSEYLYYWLKTIDFKDLTHATTLPSLRLSKVQEIRILLPPLPEQHRIVAKIEKLFTRLDAGVQALKKIKAQLSRYRQAVLKHAFEGKLTKEWRESHKGEMEPASVLLERIREERAKSAKGRYNEPPPLDTCDLPELPEGWVWTSLGELAALNPKFMDDIPDELEVSFIPMKCVEELTGQVDLSLTKLYSEVKKGYTAFRNGDVLFAKITPCMENGKVSIVNNLKNGIGFGSTEFHVIRLNSGQMPNRFVFFFLVRESFRRDARMHMTGSAGQLRVPKIYLEEVPIPLPPLTEQHKIVEEIERCLSVADEIEKVVEQSLMQTERLRKGILKRAFEGKLVPQDPTDELAEELLKRIRAERSKIEAEKKATGKTRRS